MRSPQILALLVLGILLIFSTLMGACSYYGAVDYGADQESTLKQRKASIDNIKSEGMNSLMESASVINMKAEDAEELMSIAMSSRAEGTSDAAMVWLQEQYPAQVTDELYNTLQRQIEIVRTRSANYVENMLTVKQGYEASLNKNAVFMRGWWLARAGYPTINLDDYDVLPSKYVMQSKQQGYQAPIKFDQ